MQPHARLWNLPGPPAVSCSRPPSGPRRPTPPSCPCPCAPRQTLSLLVGLSAHSCRRWRRSLIRDYFGHCTSSLTCFKRICDGELASQNELEEAGSRTGCAKGSTHQDRMMRSWRAVEACLAAPSWPPTCARLDGQNGSAISLPNSLVVACRSGRGLGGSAANGSAEPAALADGPSGRRREQSLIRGRLTDRARMILRPPRLVDSMVCCR